MKEASSKMSALILAMILAYLIACKETTIAVNDASNVEAQSATSPDPVKIPTPEQNIKETGLVELNRLDPSIKLDIRYATANNFVGKVIYNEARAFMQRPAADALARIHKKLKVQGIGLVIFNGYRPLSATKTFWEVTPANKKQFVADPKNGSHHNRGCAVDLSLFDLKTGDNLDMPTDFDDFTTKAAIDFPGATEIQKRNRQILRKAMESDDFKIYPTEWWHYDFEQRPESRILNTEFADID
jgi:D-alanyl-D-alanine dipeptidase